jgi:hypothetical protein
MSEPNQLTLDTPMTPARVLRGHPDHRSSDRRRGRWAVPARARGNDHSLPAIRQIPAGHATTDAAALAHRRVADPAGDVERSDAERHSRFHCHPRCCASERQTAAGMTASEQQVPEQIPQQHQAAEQIAALLATAAAAGATIASWQVAQAGIMKILRDLGAPRQGRPATRGQAARSAWGVSAGGPPASSNGRPPTNARETSEDTEGTHLSLHYL